DDAGLQHHDPRSGHPGRLPQQPARRQDEPVARRARGGERWSRPIEPVGSVLVAYAARDGTTALDGNGRNSPFTAALLRNIETPGVEVTFVFRNVRDDVMEATSHEQQPFVYGSLSRKAIYLAGLPPPSSASPTQANAMPAAAAPESPAAATSGPA